MRYPYEVNLVGDAAATLRALIPLLRRKTDRVVAGEHRGRRRALVGDHGHASRASTPTRSTRCCCSRELSPRLPDDAIVTADSGSSANWYARQLRFRGSMRGSLSGNLATMGPGVPYGIGAKFAHPDRPVIVFAGDGAMQMNGLAELITISRYWQEWADPRLVVAVLHNDDLNQVTWEMRAMAGRTEVRRVPVPARRRLRRVRRGLGLPASAVDKPGRRRRRPGTGRWPPTGPPCWTCAPTRTCRPIPPHATFDQMKAAAAALLQATRTGGGSGVKTSSRSSCRHGRAERCLPPRPRRS